MLHFFSTRRSAFLLAASLLFAAVGFGACGDPSRPPGTTDGPLAPQDRKEAERPQGKDYYPFSQPYSTGTPPKYVPVTHLSVCEASTDCSGRVTPQSGEQACVNLLGDPLCYYPCDPKKGTGDTQNPDCLLPENCLELKTDGGQTVGYCIYIPGQLYGNGSYKAVIRHPLGGQCLIRYGGCDTGLLCVDVRGNGSIGTCEPECIPVDDATTNDKSCADKKAGTTCKRLASGFGACLPK
ncbi:MAG: hypothetical protein H6727_03485 [Myxococcales bacterium]|nr:hypothetical protein [Myxococcales bacterium]